MNARCLAILAAWGGVTGIFPASAGSSSNYAVVAETLAAGGQAFASATYGGVACVGGIGGISAGAPAAAARHGYVGQLYEIRALEVEAASTSVNENASLPLSPVLMLDDRSRLAVPPAAIGWSVASGPIASVTGGLAVAAVVYRDTQAVVSGRYRLLNDSIGLMVINTNNDDFKSYANDGISDDWQAGFFGEENPQAGPTLDPDEDLQDNLFEYIAGTAPTISTSAFYMTSARVEENPAWINVLFSPRWEDRRYDVQSSADLLAGFAGLAAGATNDAGLQRIVTDTNATDALKFYRVNILWP